MSLSSWEGVQMEFDTSLKMELMTMWCILAGGVQSEAFIHQSVSMDHKFSLISSYFQLIAIPFVFVLIYGWRTSKKGQRLCGYGTIRPQFCYLGLLWEMGEGRNPEGLCSLFFLTEQVTRLLLFLFIHLMSTRYFCNYFNPLGLPLESVILSYNKRSRRPL